MSDGIDDFCCSDRYFCPSDPPVYRPEDLSRTPHDDDRVTIEGADVGERLADNLAIYIYWTSTVAVASPHGCRYVGPRGGGDFVVNVCRSVDNH